MNLPGAFEEKMKELLGEEFNKNILLVTKNRDIMGFVSTHRRFPWRRSRRSVL